MSEIKISVIVPIYKVGRYLNQCISSIRAQTLTDIEIILVDEGDDDECYSIMQKHSTTDSRIKIIHEKNGGYGPSCNKGLDIAKGEYISIIESDDFIDQNMYMDLYEIAKLTRADIIKASFYNYYDDQDNSSHCEYADYMEYVTDNTPCIKYFVLEYPALFSVHPSIWSAIYSRKIIDKYRFPKGKNEGYVDSDIRLKILMKNPSIVWVPKAYYYYRQTNSNASSFQGNYNITKMIKRWKNIFDTLDVEQKYKNEITSALMPEFWCCVVEHVYKNNYRSKEWYSQIKEYLPVLPKEVILAAPAQKRLPHNYRERIINLFEANSYKEIFADTPHIFLLERIKATRIYKILKVFQFYILFRANLINIHLLNNYSKTIFATEINILNFFKIYLRLGK